MLKYYDYAVTFKEFPDEISLCVNITNCPGHCENCSEPWLLKNHGTELTFDIITKLISDHSDISLFGLMGGDSDHEDCLRIIHFIHQNFPNIKVGMYSGKDVLDINLASELDYYKIGRWISPTGPQDKWHLINCGPINFPYSNQLMFKRIGNQLINITKEFRKEPLNNLERYIIS